MRSHLPLTALLAILCVSTSFQTSDTDQQLGKPVKIDTENFDTVIVESQQPALVFFGVSELDGTAQAGFIKELDSLATKHAGISTVGTVDCGDKGTGAALCKKLMIDQQPGIKIYRALKKRNPYTHSFYKESENYKGELSARAMSIALQSQLVDASITRINSLADWENWSDDYPIPKVLVFSDKEKASMLIKGLALHFTDRLLFAYVSPSVPELMDNFHVTSTPKVVLRKTSGDVVPYEGAINAFELQQFLSKYAPERVADEVNRKNLEDTVPISDREARYSNKTLSEVPGLLETSEDIWLLFFIDRVSLTDAACVKSVARFSHVVNNIGEMFSIALVALEKDEVPGAPDGLFQKYVQSSALASCELVLQLKPFGEDIVPTDLDSYDGSFEGKELQDELYGMLPELTAHMSEEALPAFLSMSPGGVNPFSPKIILGTKKKEAPGLFKALAANFRHRDVAFGWYSSDLDAEVASKFKAPRLPSVIAAYIEPTSQPDKDGNVPLAMIPFQMPLKYTFLANFVETVTDRFGRAGDQGGKDDDKEEFSGNIRHEIGPLLELQSDADMAMQCQDKGGICLIALLDGSTTAATEVQLPLLQTIRSTRKDQPIHFMWVDASKQRTFCSALSIEAGTDTPTLVLVSPRKKRMARLSSQFALEPITQLIDRLVNAQVPTTSLPQMPNLIQGGEAPEEAVAVEEFDLSDILGEDLGGFEDRSAQLEAAVIAVERESAARAEREAKESAEAQAKKDKKKKAKKKAKKKKKKEAAEHTEL